MGRIARRLGIAGISVALAGCWAVPGQNAGRTAHNPFESRLTAATVGELTEAWRFDFDFGIPLAASDPVVSSAGVHVVLGGCVAVTVAPADGQWPLPGSAVSPLCESGDTAFMQMVRDFSPPYVVGDRLLWSYWGAWDTNAPRPPNYVLYGGVTHHDLATDQLLSTSGGPGMLLAAVRDDTAVAMTYRVVSTVPPPPWPQIPIQSIDGDTVVGSLTDPAARRTIDVTGGRGATLGADAFYASGSGTLATTPGDPAVGAAVRAYSVSEPRPGCGPSANVECPLWATPIDGTAPPAVLSVGGSVVYVGTSAGTMYALDAATGAVQWTAAVGAAVSASPALADGTLYVPTADGRLVAVDATDGATLWATSTGSPLGVQPAVAGDVVYTGSDDGSVQAFAAQGCEAATCAALWSAQAGGRITGAPAVTGGQVYVGTAQGHLVAYALP
ncbi:MAG TPA: PQQ-binding-like beta-propeller repeat protein [Acidimicrobiales bacterium]|nr:PQQ-binding-like beta-propeller repeat protein [Acidimicrobiales bacterium]